MGLTYRIVAEGRLAIFTATGVVTLEDVRSIAMAFRRDPVFSPDLRQLIRVEAESSSMTAVDWMAMGDSVGPTARGRRAAIVAQRDHQYGAARQFQMAYGQEGQDIRVFRNEAAALEWLGFTPADLEGA